MSRSYPGEIERAREAYDKLKGRWEEDFERRYGCNRVPDRTPHRFLLPEARVLPLLCWKARGAVRGVPRLGISRGGGVSAWAVAGPEAAPCALHHDILTS